MPYIAVSLDLETTGLDPNRDAIMEIAAVKFRGRQILGTFSTLVNPERTIPLNVVELTGLHQKDVDHAPPLHDALRRLTDFVRDLPIVGHSIGVDLAFLHRHHVFKFNRSIDTFELAAILLPHAKRYALSALASELGIDIQATHRALADAKVAHALYMRLEERARDLPESTLQEIVRLGEQIGWPLRRFFEDALQSNTYRRGGEESIGAQLAAKKSAIVLHSSKRSSLASLVRATMVTHQTNPPPVVREQIPWKEMDCSTRVIDINIEELISKDEDPQKWSSLMRTICETLNQHDRRIIETSIQARKGLAYLLPAIHWAVVNNQCVLIAVNSSGALENLIHRELPFLKKILPFEFNSATLKPRSHYLCPRQLIDMLYIGPNDEDEMRVLAKVLVWLPSTTSGDKSELLLSGASERAVWAQLSGSLPTCTPERCKSWNESGCYAHHAIQQAQTAHIVIADHAVLVGEIDSKEETIPEYQYLIIDEAQKFEQAVTERLTFSAHAPELLVVLDGLKSLLSNRLPRFLATLHSRTATSKQGEIVSKLGADINRMQPALATIETQSTVFFAAVSMFVNKTAKARHDASRRVRIMPETCNGPNWEELVAAWEGLNLSLSLLLTDLVSVSRLLKDFASPPPENYQTIHALLLRYHHRLQSIHNQIESTLTPSSEEQVCWLDVDELGVVHSQDTPLPSFHTAPLSIRQLGKEKLFAGKIGISLVSENLRVGRSFDFIVDRLGAQSAQTLVLDPRPDLKASMMLYIAGGIPGPESPGYQKAIDQYLADLCNAVTSRTLVLFTSISQLRTAARSLKPILTQQGIVVFEQTEKTSRRQLLEQFEASENGVLLGARSFWEDLDLPKNAISCVVIPRLPFATRGDPIFMARSESYSDSFMQFVLPDAVLRFRQGVGPFVRARPQRSVLAILDCRVIDNRFGDVFLQSLPECTVQVDTNNNIGGVVEKWLQKSA